MTSSKNRLSGHQLDVLAKLLDADWLKRGKGEFPLVEQLCLDTRKIGRTAGALFVAMKGPNHNGHDYIKKAFKLGIRLFLVEDDVDNLFQDKEAKFSDVWCLRVENSLEAFQKIASYHRHKFDYPVVGITGSNGKTSVKEWLHQLLWKDLHLVRSPKSFNSQVGVPLSVWQMNEMHQMALIEAGISLPGEMEKLQKIIDPSIGILTHFGPAHAKGFKSEVQKLKEKLFLFKSAERIIYNADIPEIETVLNALELENPNYFKAKRLRWSDNPQEVPCKPGARFTDSSEFPALWITQKNVKADSCYLEAIYEDEEHSLSLNFSDGASIENAISCWLFLLGLNYTQDEIQARFKELQPLAMRMELKRGKNQCSIIDDAYNSDRNSLEIALDFQQQQKGNRLKTVVLSDILQSGKAEKQLYTEVAQLLAENKVNRLIGIGPKITKNRAVFTGLKSRFYSSTEALIEDLPEFKNEIVLVKGARKFALEKVVNALALKRHGTRLEIKMASLISNLTTYRKRLKKGVKLMAMVKSFAYGAGLEETARMLEYNQVDYLAIAYADEGVQLRQAGILTPIMVLNSPPEAFPLLYKHNLEPELYSLDQLDELCNFINENNLQDQKLGIHIMLDTGMRRLGFEEEDLDSLIQKLQALSFLKVKSIFSHLAAGESGEHDEFSRKQIELFQKRAKIIEEGLGEKLMKHILNSSGILRFPEKQFDMVRLGIGLYGFDPTGLINDELEVVSSLKTSVSQIKEVEANQSIGYGRMGKLKGKGRIATLNIGYGDGYPRSFGNGKGKVFVNGHYSPIIGNVCMDMTMVDVSEISEIQVGDTAELFGENISIKELAEWESTIPYEIFTRISERVQRWYIHE